MGSWHGDNKRKYIIYKSVEGLQLKKNKINLLDIKQDSSYNVDCTIFDYII